MTEWIKCSERSPENPTESTDAKSYLVTDTDVIEIAAFFKHRFHSEFEYTRLNNRHITHWAELPEVPHD